MLSRLQYLDGSNGSKYKMLGNAVPPRFSAIIASVIKKIISIR